MKYLNCSSIMIAEAYSKKRRKYSGLIVNESILDDKTINNRRKENNTRIKRTISSNEFTDG